MSNKELVLLEYSFKSEIYKLSFNPILAFKFRDILIIQITLKHKK